jgi:hypothetical protein
VPKAIAMTDQGAPSGCLSMERVSAVVQELNPESVNAVLSAASALKGRRASVGHNAMSKIKRGRI